MILNDSIFLCIFILMKKPNGSYKSHVCKSIPKNIYIFFFYFFLKCILLQINHKKCFLLIFLYSGVAYYDMNCLT